MKLLPKYDQYKVISVITAGVCALFASAMDQVTKLLAVINLSDGPRILIPRVLELRLVTNTGVAWSMMEGKTLIITIISAVLMLCVLAAIVLMPGFSGKWQVIHAMAGLLLGGAIGNFMDRLNFGYVIDFIYVSAIHFPVFNVADCFIVCSVITMAIMFIFVMKDADMKPPEAHEA